MIWLASGSPRRKQLLEDAGYAVTVHPPAIDETFLPSESAEAYVGRLAQAKAAKAPADAFALAADTTVWLEPHRVLGKPTSREHAAHMLRALSGREHHVSTGVCMGRAGHRDVFVVTSLVRFRELDDAEIARFLATGEADDKAGAYAIQGRSAGFIFEIHGSWTNVMGLPLEQVLPRLRGLS